MFLINVIDNGTGRGVGYVTGDALGTVTVSADEAKAYKTRAGAERGLAAQEQVFGYNFTLRIVEA